MNPRRSFERDDADTMAWAIGIAIVFIAFIGVVGSCLAGCGDAFSTGVEAVGVTTTSDAGLAAETSMGIVQGAVPEAAASEASAVEATVPEAARESGTQDVAPIVPSTVNCFFGGTVFACNSGSTGVLVPFKEWVNYWPYGDAGAAELCDMAPTGPQPVVACPSGARCQIVNTNGGTYNGVCE